MAALFHVDMILPGKVAYEGEISSLVAPAATGYLGVLAHHAPIIAELKPGDITLRDSAGKTSKFILKTAGFLEVSGNKATLLLDSIEIPA